nr:hypothetical protein [uncultured Chitinophaga sp.]
MHVINEDFPASSLPRMGSNVLLPAPEEPTMVTISPLLTEISTPFSTERLE